MSRFQTSWEIAKRSWAVLKSDKTLAWFPVLSAIGSLLVFAVFGGLIALMGIDSSSTGDSLQPIGWVLIVCTYLALAMVQTYFLAGLLAGAAAAGQRPGPCAPPSTSPTPGSTGSCRGRRHRHDGPPGDRGVVRAVGTIVARVGLAWNL
jgi:hypothetical protein